MSRPATAWTATLRLRTGRTEVARWLAEALAPEAAREVPRARATVRRSGADVELRLSASDAGAMRAALNTYLGWVDLSLATLAAAGEALISRSR